jgi:hypothetical protein
MDVIEAFMKKGFTKSNRLRETLQKNVACDVSETTERLRSAGK